MVEIKVNYDGQLRCVAQHGPSSSALKTDAPVDNKGRGESYSPTDLVATALGTCMATIMGIVADQKGIDLIGMKIVVEKEMSPDSPRRVSALHLQIDVPISEDHPDKEALVQGAVNCPVQHSIHPDIDVRVAWSWAE